MIDVFATSPHYADHLAAVFTHLPPDARGAFLTPHTATAERIRRLGFEVGRLNGAERPVLVAAYGDMVIMASSGRKRIALMEHGAGQSYAPHSLHGSYAGGLHRDAASLFLHPGTHPAERDRRAYPRARVEVTGSPFLDLLPKRKEKGRVVAFTFHFNGSVCAETKTAYPHFFPFVAGLASKYEMLGTGHPMMWDVGRPGKRLADRYKAQGIEPVRDFAEVCRRADVLLFDNSSVGFAFAATGRPVVVLNSPRYDRRVDHGLRFWQAASVGVNCDDPRLLEECIEEALADPPERKEARKAALDLVYAYRTGAGKRSAEALMDWVA